ncbi:SHOCT domain-containing protein [Asticcacaulis biprosthecium]|uniref:SHOCT domain-containing protein n=1 Tax=Asticcacaulis biprosthecium TaxID=76891 RepID=UPI0002E7BE2F|nr:SHOCT domain-containing protein [Asticcacaulis biprosthecium]
MKRWDELERVGKLHAEGLLSDEEFAAQKRRILETDSPDEKSQITVTDLASRLTAKRQNSTPFALIAGAAGFLVLLSWLVLSLSHTNWKTSFSVAGAESPQPKEYALRSNVAGASLVRLQQLPAVKSYDGDADNYCGDPDQYKAQTPGGKIAQQQGWRVVKEEAFQRLDSVFIIRGYDPGTSGHCFTKDANLAFFDGGQLIGVLYGKGKNAIGINNIEIVGDHLRVSDDVIPVGQISLKNHSLTFDKITGSDVVCGGEYNVPVVFGQTFSKARELLGNSGWKAPPGTKERFVGDDAQVDPLRFPELDSCSGTGYAYCFFTLQAKGGVAKLSIITQGESDDPVVVDYKVFCDGRDDE